MKQLLQRFDTGALRVVDVRVWPTWQFWTVTLFRQDSPEDP
jgi:hypothetical protein